jgi:hypothetical protein
LRSMRTAVPLALAVGVVAAAPGIADAKPPVQAKASGGDVVTLQYPSLVKTRVGRAKRALRRAITKVENGQATLAVPTFKVVRRQMGAAWRGAKYVIRTTPPPPPADDARVHVRAHKAGGAPVGPTLAAPADTAMLVLTLQHKVAANIIQLVDGAHGTGLNALATGGAPVASTFDTVMPNLIPLFADELQGIDGLKSDATDLTTGGRRVLNAAENQIENSQAFVNTHWPPVVPED